MAKVFEISELPGMYFSPLSLWSASRTLLEVPLSRDQYVDCLLNFAVRSAKFSSEKQWVVAGANDMLMRMYTYASTFLDHTIKVCAWIYLSTVCIIFFSMIVWLSVILIVLFFSSVILAHMVWTSPWMPMWKEQTVLTSDYLTGDDNSYLVALGTDDHTSKNLTIF